MLSIYVFFFTQKTAYEMLVSDWSSDVCASDLLNKRQLESLAGASAFDCITPDRASVHSSAETIMGHASAAADQRESGQHALFGVGGAGLAPIRLEAVSPWSLSERITPDKYASGF